MDCEHAYIDLHQRLMIIFLVFLARLDSGIYFAELYIHKLNVYYKFSIKNGLHYSSIVAEQDHCQTMIL